MKTVTGVGDMLALSILYETHQIDRFSRVQHYAYYCRVQRSSNNHFSYGRNQKMANPYLKWAIADIIIHASHKSSLIGSYYQNLQTRFGKRKAKSMINHKFGIAIYYLLKNKQMFDEGRFVQTTMT